MRTKHIYNASASTMRVCMLYENKTCCYVSLWNMMCAKTLGYYFQTVNMGWSTNTITYINTGSQSLRQWHDDEDRCQSAIDLARNLEVFSLWSVTAAPVVILWHSWLLPRDANNDSLFLVNDGRLILVKYIDYDLWLLPLPQCIYRRSSMGWSKCG